MFDLGLRPSSELGKSKIETWEKRHEIAVATISMDNRKGWKAPEVMKHGSNNRPGEAGT